MIPASLADFLELASAAGELARVEVEVDPDLEIAAITDRVVKESGPALLFERVRGREMVVVTNLFGTTKRICLALGVDSLEEFAVRAGERSGGPPQNWLDRLKARPGEPALERFVPKLVKVAPCQQVVHLGSDVDLGRLPALRSWPEETGPSITAGLLVTADPAREGQQYEPVELPILGRNQLAVALNPYSAARRQFEDAAEPGGKLPVAVVLAASPLVGLLAQMPLPENIDLLSLTGVIAEQALEVVACRTQSLQAPAAAEIVIEGYLAPAADITNVSADVALPNGFYSCDTRWRVLHVTAMTHRANAAFPAAVFAQPPTEQTAVGRLVERMMLDWVRAVAPEVTDLALPPFAMRRGVVFVAMRKQYAGQARKVASALWGLSALMLAKLMVLVDERVDVHDTSAVLFRISSNVDLERDVFFQQGPADPLDHASCAAGPTQKMGIDATSKHPGEGSRRTPSDLSISPATRQLIEERWQEYGLRD